jgi:hypothetical protein
LDGRKETVLKAITRTGPERIPLLYAYSLEKSDIVNIPVVNHFLDGGVSEWGFEWEHLDNALLMGQPKRPVIENYAQMERCPFPDPYDSSRFAHVKAIMDKYGPDRYYKANFVLSGFAIISMLRGFSNVMEDFYLDSEDLDRLCDIVFSFENDVIRQAASHGFSAIGLADDWGTQESLLISPAMWRDVFKPRYKEQIELAHSFGLHVYMHSCGYIFDIIGDLIEIGLDILNPGQPDINDVPEMGRQFAGKICFACPPSYQTTSISGSKEDLAAQIRQYKSCLIKNGGLIGIIPEDSAPLGITDEMFREMEKNFKEKEL